MDSVVEVRCPAGPRKLFTKLRLTGESVRYIQPDNLIEFACDDCSRRLNREHGTRIRVLHRFNFLGELIATSTEDRDQ